MMDDSIIEVFIGKTVTLGYIVWRENPNKEYDGIDMLFKSDVGRDIARSLQAIGAMNFNRLYLNKDSLWRPWTGDNKQDMFEDVDELIAIIIKSARELYTQLQCNFVFHVIVDTHLAVEKNISDKINAGIKEGIKDLFSDGAIFSLENKVNLT